jgi:hypothetical protein
MLSVHIRHILTLVVCLLCLTAIAAPHEDSPNPKTEDMSEGETIDPRRTENISISEPPPVAVSDSTSKSFRKSDYFYPYRKELDIHAGVVFGIEDSSDDEDLMNAIIGFGYMLPREVSPKWVLGADLSLVGHGHLWAQRRIVYREKSSFRPFYQYGLMHKVVPDEKFSSFSNWDNYLARAGIGFADILRPPRSVQLELNLAVGMKDVLVTFTYGYAWGH